ncbi:hypothetical protein JKP88DRAFT_353413 [Tribonema minus]|uniref:Peptidase M16 C-terminal domain-containing protein n=1 Tax=Tribonema minus TaxID=303371 RepID=A0A836CK49_9STRA|nr:hypothetical protein JKP88DRAFT_353413 [Tribonema minus]
MARQRGKQTMVRLAAVLLVVLLAADDCHGFSPGASSLPRQHARASLHMQQEPGSNDDGNKRPGLGRVWQRIASPVQRVRKRLQGPTDDWEPVIGSDFSQKAAPPTRPPAVNGSAGGDVDIFEDLIPEWPAAGKGAAGKAIPPPVPSFPPRPPAADAEEDDQPRRRAALDVAMGPVEALWTRLAAQATTLETDAQRSKAAAAAAQMGSIQAELALKRAQGELDAERAAKAAAAARAAEAQQREARAREEAQAAELAARQTGAERVRALEAEVAQLRTASDQARLAQEVGEAAVARGGGAALRGDAAERRCAPEECGTLLCLEGRSASYTTVFTLQSKQLTAEQEKQRLAEELRAAQARLAASNAAAAAERAAFLDKDQELQAARNTAAQAKKAVESELEAARAERERAAESLRAEQRRLALVATQLKEAQDAAAARETELRRAREEAEAAAARARSEVQRLTAQLAQQEEALAAERAGGASAQAAALAAQLQSTAAALDAARAEAVDARDGAARTVRAEAAARAQLEALLERARTRHAAETADLRAEAARTAGYDALAADLEAARGAAAARDAELRGVRVEREGALAGLREAWRAAQRWREAAAAREAELSAANRERAAAQAEAAKVAPLVEKLSKVQAELKEALAALQTTAAERDELLARATTAEERNDQLQEMYFEMERSQEADSWELKKLRTENTSLQALMERNRERNTRATAQLELDRAALAADMQQLSADRDALADLPAAVHRAAAAEAAARERAAAAEAELARAQSELDGARSDAANARAGANRLQAALRSLGGDSAMARIKTAEQKVAAVEARLAEESAAREEAISAAAAAAEQAAAVEAQLARANDEIAASAARAEAAEREKAELAEASEHEKAELADAVKREKAELAEAAERDKAALSEAQRAAAAELQALQGRLAASADEEQRWEARVRELQQQVGALEMTVRVITAPRPVAVPAAAVKAVADAAGTVVIDDASASAAGEATAAAEQAKASEVTAGGGEGEKGAVIASEEGEGAQDGDAHGVAVANGAAAEGSSATAAAGEQQSAAAVRPLRAFGATAAPAAPPKKVRTRTRQAMKDYVYVQRLRKDEVPMWVLVTKGAYPCRVVSVGKLAAAHSSAEWGRALQKGDLVVAGVEWGRGLDEEIQGLQYSMLKVTEDTFPASLYVSNRTGLRVCCAEVDGPVVNGYFALATESADTEYSGLHDGLPHVVQHMVLAGSEAATQRSVLERLARRALGRGPTAWVDVDRTVYLFSTAEADGFLSIAPAVLDHLLHPALTDAAFLTEVHHTRGPAAAAAASAAAGSDGGAVYAEMAERAGSGEERCASALRAALFGAGDARAAAAGGLPQRLRALAPAAARRCHAAYYRPDNLCVVVTGRVSAARVLAALEPADAALAAHTARRGAAAAPPRPWWSAPPPPLPPQSGAGAAAAPPGAAAAATAMAETLGGAEVVEFPAAGEGAAAVVMLGWRLPEGCDLQHLAALRVLWTYLTEAPGAPLHSAFLERGDPLCASIAFETREGRPGWHGVTFRDCDVARLDEVRVPRAGPAGTGCDCARLNELAEAAPCRDARESESESAAPPSAESSCDGRSLLLRCVLSTAWAIADVVAFDMEQLAHVVHREVLRYRSDMEDAPGDRLAAKFIRHFLFAPRGAAADVEGPALRDRLQNAASRLASLPTSGPAAAEYWRALAEDALSPERCRCAAARPSAAAAARRAAEDAQRAAAAARRLGAEGLAAADAALAAAEAALAEEPAESALAAALTPDAASVPEVPLISVRFAREGGGGGGGGSSGAGTSIAVHSAGEAADDRSGYAVAAHLCDAGARALVAGDGGGASGGGGGGGAWLAAAEWDHVRSAFVEAAVWLDTRALPPALRVHLPLLLALLFDCPLSADGGGGGGGAAETNRESAVRQLSRDAVAYGASLGAGRGGSAFECGDCAQVRRRDERCCVNARHAAAPHAAPSVPLRFVRVWLRAEAGKYARAARWLRRALFDSVVTADGLVAAATRLLDETAALKATVSVHSVVVRACAVRDGAALARVTMDLIAYDLDVANACAASPMRQQPQLARTLRRLARCPADVVAEVEALLAALRAPERVSLHIVGDLLAHPGPVTPWLGRSSSSSSSSGGRSGGGGATPPLASAAPAAVALGVPAAPAAAAEAAAAAAAAASTRSLRTQEARQPHGRGLLVVRPDSEQHAEERVLLCAPCDPRRGDAELPALLVAAEYLSGGGSDTRSAAAAAAAAAAASSALSRCAFSVRPERGMMFLEVRGGGSGAGGGGSGAGDGSGGGVADAVAAARAAVQATARGGAGALDAATLEAARARVAFGLVEQGATTARAAARSMLAFLRGEPQDLDRRIMAAAVGATPAQVAEAIEVHLARLVDPTRSTLVGVVRQSTSAEARAALVRAGYPAVDATTLEQLHDGLRRFGRRHADDDTSTSSYASSVSSSTASDAFDAFDAAAAGGAGGGGGGGGGGGSGGFAHGGVAMRGGGGGGAAQGWFGAARRGQIVGLLALGAAAGIILIGKRR